MISTMMMMMLMMLMKMMILIIMIEEAEGGNIKKLKMKKQNFRNIYPLVKVFIYKILSKLILL